MTPAHGSGSPGDDSQELDTPTIPIPLPQPRRTPRLRTPHRALGHSRTARPSTVWACAQDDLREGTGLLANWLLTAVIKIVTNYTQPGQRVLLLEPASYLAPPASRPATMVRNRPRPVPYEGLHEAGWAVVRLGRGVQTHIAVAHPCPVGERTVDGSESGPRLHARSPFAGGPAGPSADRLPVSDSATTGHGPDRYDLIITAADPRTLDWFRPAGWAGLLTSNGTLAVVTHGDRSSGQLADPAGELVRTAHHAGLRYLDRIALLRVPVRDGTLAVTTSAVRARSQAQSERLTTSFRHLQVHEDLLVFTNRSALSRRSDGEVTSDG
ncbi:hypothetical protein ACXIZN_24560 [Amycolatopsis sp. TRM77291]